VAFRIERDLLVSFTLHQLTSIVAGPAYQVVNTVTAATDASLAAYVFQTSNQQFNHYATAADMDQWPDTYEKAQVTNAAFYRLPTITRTWDTVEDMNEDLDVSLRRLQSLADELNAQRGALIVDRTTTVVGG
jgi:hypothetical protein